MTAARDNFAAVFSAGGLAPGPGELRDTADGGVAYGLHFPITVKTTSGEVLSERSVVTFRRWKAADDWALRGVTDSVEQTFRMLLRLGDLSSEELHAADKADLQLMERILVGFTLPPRNDGETGDTSSV